jgi:cell division septal protein FtsQ
MSHKMSRARIKRKNEPTSKSPWLLVVMAMGAVLIVVVGFLAWNGSNSKKPSATPQVTGGPKLSVDRDSIDFGKLPLDQPVRAEFKLKNVGDQPLAIKGEPRVELVKGC